MPENLQPLKKKYILYPIQTKTLDKNERLFNNTNSRKIVILYIFAERALLINR